MAFTDSSSDDSERDKTVLNFSLDEARGASSVWPRAQQPQAAESPSKNPAASHPLTAEFLTKGVQRILDIHIPLVNRRRAVAASTTGRVLRLREDVDNGVNDQNHAAVDRSKARARYARTLDDPYHGAVRDVSTAALLALLLVGGSASVIVDRVQLRSLFQLLSVGTVTLTSIFLGVVQTVSAHKAGEHHQYAQDEDSSVMGTGAAETSRRIATWSAVTGLGSVALLALWRVYRGDFGLAAIFGLGGAAIWVAMTGLSYLWASKEATRVVSTAKSYEKKSEKAGKNREELATANGNYGTQIDALRAEADKGASHLEAEVFAFHQRLADAGMSQYTPPLPAQYREWCNLRDPSVPLPSDLTLPEWDWPFTIDTSHIDGIAKVTQNPFSNRENSGEEARGPFELGPGRADEGQ